MNAHAAIDRAVIPVTRAFLGGFRMFSGSLDGPALAEQVEGAAVDLPRWGGEGAYEVPAQTPRGSADPAFLVARWLGRDHPTILYHHGNNERPFDFGVASKNSFKNVLLAGRGSPAANLIALRAPFHRSFKTYMSEMRDLAAFTAMLAVSCRLVEALVDRLAHEGMGAVVVAGFSLGGWVTNLHRASFGTAHAYVPMAAGAALDDTVIDSAWSGTVSPAVRRNEALVRSTLNFERAFGAVRRDDVFPLLGRYDQYVRHDVQARTYGSHPVATRDKGHITLLADAAGLREHLLAHVPQAAYPAAHVSSGGTRPTA